MKQKPRLHAPPLSPVLYVLPICMFISTSNASVLAYEGFGNAANAVTVNAYSGSSAESGLTGAWTTTGGTTTTTTPPRFGKQVGIFNGAVVGLPPEATGGAQHALTHSGYNVTQATRPLAASVDLTTDGTYYMSFFAAADGFDIVTQVGLSNATHELMAGQAYNGNRGLAGYYATNGSSVSTGTVTGNNLGSFTWGDRNAFFTIQLTKTNSGTTNNLAVTITAYDLGNTTDIDISTLVEGTTKKTRTVNLTGVSATFTHLKFKLDGTADMDEIRLGTTLADVAQGVDSDSDQMLDSWEITHFGNLSRDGSLDFDSEGLTDLLEYQKNTNPTLADTDGDALTDNQEVTGSANAAFANEPTNPLKSDSDGDKASDGEEINGTLNTSFSNAATNPNATDTDADGANDYKELVYHSNPNDSGNLPTPSLFYLIDNTLLNGSFETKNGGVTIGTTKITSWDAVGNDIDNWKQFAGPAGDSGVEGNASHGTRSGYFQSGNSAYNLTSSVAAAGAVYACTWKQRNSGGSTISVKLGYWNGTAFIEIPASLTTTNTAGGVGDLIYQIPSGSPAIGFPIGISMGSTGTWIGVDEVALNIAATGDDDGDGMPNLWETANGLNPNSNVGANGAAGDADSDGLTNIQEFTAGTHPNLADTDSDGLNDGPEISGALNTGYSNEPTNPLISDSDLDGLLDGAEVNASPATNPNLADSDFDGWNDNLESFYGTNATDIDSIPVLYELIGLTKRNGGFELLNGVVNPAKASHWDTDPDGDVDNWTVWTEQSTAENDSGTEGNPKHGYIQNGNAVRNMTTYSAKAGDKIRLTYDRLTGGTVTAYLIIDATDLSLGYIQIPASTAQSTNSTGNKNMIFAVPTGNIAIGRKIGVAFKSTGGWESVDNVKLTVEDIDSDADGLSDFWEDRYFGNNDEGPTAPELAIATGAGDNDSDTYNNIAEQAAGSNPNNAASNPGDTDFDGLADDWENVYYGSITAQNGTGDPDGDRDTNLVEFTNSTNPNLKNSFYSSTSDTGASDSWKTFYTISLTTDSNVNDQDSDGLVDAAEFNAVTNPIIGDTDADGRLDGAEINGSPTSNPLVADTDGDTVSDGAEITAGSNPNVKDTDADGYNDNVEITAGSLPALATSTPVTITGATVLIDTLHNNGSFELLGGVASAAHAGHWDTDVDGDVDHWAVWNSAVGGPSTAEDNSGTQAGGNATAGTRISFLQSNNAVYNITTPRLVVQGDEYKVTWDHLNALSVTVSLVYDNAGVITLVPGTSETSTIAGNGKGGTYVIPSGSPAIGKTIGLAIVNNNSGFAEVDNFVLSLVPGSNPDSDSDGMTDAWEITYFSGLGQSSTSDFDNDGTDNLTEFRLGLIPNSGTSRFAATISNSGLIQWPSVTGVTFKIERSTSLESGSWTTLQAAQAGTASTASFTDPAPPATKAFYRIVLNP